MADLKFFFFDASAICRMILLNEPGADKVGAIINDRIINKIYTSWVVIAETLGVLKRRWSSNDANSLSEQEYQDAVTKLFRFIKDTTLNCVDMECTNDVASLVTYESHIKKLREKYSYLDAADALQLAAIKKSFLRLPGGKSKTKLVSADKKLIEAAKSEGISTIPVNR